MIALFERTGTNDQIGLNSDLVVKILPGARGLSSWVEYGHVDQTKIIEVKGTMEEVISKLNGVSNG